MVNPLSLLRLFCVTFYHCRDLLPLSCRSLEGFLQQQQQQHQKLRNPRAISVRKVFLKKFKSFLKNPLPAPNLSSGHYGFISRFDLESRLKYEI